MSIRKKGEHEIKYLQRVGIKLPKIRSLKLNKVKQKKEGKEKKKGRFERLAP